MSKWPGYPTISETNTWVWLSDFSEKLGTSTDLSSVPEVIGHGSASDCSIDFHFGGIGQV